VLRKWLAANAPSMAHVAEDADRLNVRLRERFGEHLQVGHSYFMEPDLDEDLLEQIWKADILPFLEEQLFGHEDELSDFSLDAVRTLAREGTEAQLMTEDGAHENDQPVGVPDRSDEPDLAGA